LTSEIAWKNNPGFLTELARHDLERRPMGAEFVAILAFHGAVDMSATMSLLYVLILKHLGAFFGK